MNGVKDGSPNKKFAIMLPANIDIIDENHKAKGCFRENAIAPEMYMRSIEKKLRISAGALQSQFWDFAQIGIEIPISLSGLLTKDFLAPSILKPYPVPAVVIIMSN